MAIWQYKIFLLPEDRLACCFENSSNFSETDFDSIEWWEGHQLKIDDFAVFYTILSRSKSWSEEIHLIGEIDSTCVEIISNDRGIEEVSARIDLRYDYRPFVKLLCDFARQYDCIFLDTELKVIAANEIVLLEEIDNYTVFRQFLDKLRD